MSPVVKIKCSRCDYVSTPRFVEMHEKTAKKTNQETLLKCKVCDYKSCIASTLRNHHTDVHIAAGDLYKETKCDRCDYVGTIKAVWHHQSRFKVEDGSVLQCEFCEFKSCGKLLLDEHKCEGKRKQEKELIDSQNVKLQSIETWKCKNCDFISDEASIIVHIQGWEKSGKYVPFVCDMCHFKTCSKELLEKHHLSEHNPTFSCDFCSFKTTTEKKLDMHHIYRELDFTPKTCHHCDITLCSVKALELHLKAVDKASEKKEKEKQSQMYSYPEISLKEVTDEENFIYEYSCTDCHFKSEYSEEMLTHVSNKHIRLIRKTKPMGRPAKKRRKAKTKLKKM